MDPISLMAVFMAGALLAERRETASAGQTQEKDEDWVPPDPTVPTLWQMLGIGPIKVLLNVNQIEFPSTEEGLQTETWRDCWRVTAGHAPGDSLWGLLRGLLREAWYGRIPEIHLKIAHGSEISITFPHTVDLDGSISVLPGSIEVELEAVSLDVSSVAESMADSMDKYFMTDSEISHTLLNDRLEILLGRRFGNQVSLGSLSESLYSDSFELAMTELSEVFKKFRNEVEDEAEQAASDIEDIEKECRKRVEEDIEEYEAEQGPEEREVDEEDDWSDEEEE